MYLLATLCLPMSFVDSFDGNVGVGVGELSLCWHYQFWLGRKLLKSGITCGWPDSCSLNLFRLSSLLQVRHGSETAVMPQAAWPECGWKLLCWTTVGLDCDCPRIKPTARVPQCRVENLTCGPDFHHVRDTVLCVIIPRIQEYEDLTCVLTTSSMVTTWIP